MGNASEGMSGSGARAASTASHEPELRLTRRALGRRVTGPAGGVCAGRAADGATDSIVLHVLRIIPLGSTAAQFLKEAREPRPAAVLLVGSRKHRAKRAMGSLLGPEKRRKGLAQCDWHTSLCPIPTGASGPGAPPA